MFAAWLLFIDNGGLGRVLLQQMSDVCQRRRVMVIFVARVHAAVGVLLCCQLVVVHKLNQDLVQTTFSIIAQ